MTLLAAACSGGEAEPVARVALADAPPAPAEAPVTTSSSSTTTSRITTTTPTVDDREAEILAVIDLFFHAVVAGMNPPDPASPLWEQVAVGDRLERLRETAARNLTEGKGTRYRDGRYSPVTRSAFLVLQDTRAVVDLCTFDNTILYDLETGATLDDELRYAHFQIVVDLTADGWRVVRSPVVERFESGHECDSAF